MLGSDEDGVQECALVFTYCLRYYDHYVDNDAWFMSLFMRAVKNHWHSLSKRDAQRRQMLPPAVDDSDHYYYQESVELAQYFTEASSELVDVLSIIANAPGELLQELFKGRRANRKLCRFAHISKTESHQVLTELHDLLRPLDRARLSASARAQGQLAARISEHAYKNACYLGLIEK